MSYVARLITNFQGMIMFQKIRLYICSHAKIVDAFFDSTHDGVMSLLKQPYLMKITTLIQKKKNNDP
jgi:hypothetical protein